MEKEKKFRTGELGCETYENVRWCSSCGPGDWDWPDKTSFWKVSLKLLIMLDYIFQKAFRVVTIMVVMMSTMLTVILIREVELNLVTDGLDSIFHQPECSSWQAEYTEIGTENGESSSWSSPGSSSWLSSTWHQGHHHGHHHGIYDHRHGHYL